MKTKTTKPVHGEPLPLWKKFGLNEFPPVECNFKIGDRVVFTNEYGLKFDMEVIGFSKDDKFYGKFIHMVEYGGNGDGGAPWFPHDPSEIVLR